MSDQPRAEAEAWRKRQPLTGADISDFIALQRICALSDTQVLQVGNEFLQDERPLLPFVADSVRGLIEVGHATLGEPDPESHHIRPVVVTVSGRERYEQLCDKQGVPLIVPEATSTGQGHS